MKLSHDLFRMLKYRNMMHPKWIDQETKKLNNAFKELNILASVKDVEIGYAAIRYYLNVDFDNVSDIFINIEKIKDILNAKTINKYIIKDKIAIELPNPFRQILLYGNIINDEYIEQKQYYMCPIGYDNKSNIVELNLKENNIILISGMKNSGKKNALNVILSSILLNVDEVLIDLIDTNESLSYLYDLKVVNIVEYDSYLDDFQEVMDDKIKRIIVISDLADMTDIDKINGMLNKIDDSKIVILLTSKLDVSILNEEFRKNIKINIALKEENSNDSIFLINQLGCENLLNMGDSYIKFDNKVVRTQIAYISEDEIEDMINYIGGNI